MTTDNRLIYDGPGLPDHVWKRVQQCHGWYMLDTSKADGSARCTFAVVTRRSGAGDYSSGTFAEFDPLPYKQKERVIVSGPHVYYHSDPSRTVYASLLQMLRAQDGAGLELLQHAEHVEVIETVESYIAGNKLVDVVSVGPTGRHRLATLRQPNSSSTHLPSLVWQALDRIRDEHCNRKSQLVRIFWYSVSDENGEKLEMCSSERILREELEAMVRRKDKRKASRMRGKSMSDPVWIRAWEGFKDQEADSQNYYTHGSQLVPFNPGMLVDASALPVIPKS